MATRSRLQAFLSGVLEGFVIGLIIALVRISLKLARTGLPEQPATVLPELIIYLGGYAVLAGYAFGMGRLIADSVWGALGGAAVLAVVGILAGTLVPYDSAEAPFPLVGGAVLGLLLGPPAGAALQKRIRSRSTARPDPGSTADSGDASR